jgi:predicted ATPase
LHLHTSAQLELSKVLIDVAKNEKRPQMLIETHSEVLLTSVQLAIANGQLSPNEVRVYWVESLRNGTSDAIPVDFDESGRPTNTVLAGAFNEAIQLGQDLITKQLAIRQ